MQTSGAPGGRWVSTLEVDLLLDGYRLAGVTSQVDEQKRLGDVLNARDESLNLRDVSVMSIKGRVLDTFAELSIEKRAIVAAVPHETAEYLKRQRMYRAGMARPSRDQAKAMVVMPPYAARGQIHLLPGVGSLRLARSLANRFFPITDVNLYLGDERIFEGPIALLNSDLVAAIGRVPAAAVTQHVPEQRSARA